MSEGTSKAAPPDPLQLWREWIDKAERQMNNALTELMGSDTFNQAQGRVMQTMLGLQSQLNQAAQRYFTTLNLPTRTDVLALGDRLSAIEERLMQIEARLGGGAKAGAKPAAARPPRTKRAPRKS